jgi:hypothetical protein
MQKGKKESPAAEQMDAYLGYLEDGKKQARQGGNHHGKTPGRSYVNKNGNISHILEEDS